MKLSVRPPDVYDWCVPFRDARKAPADPGAFARPSYPATPGSLGSRTTASPTT
jgi:hypothetical protein